MTRCTFSDMMSRRSILISAALAATLALSGCGGSEPGDAATSEDGHDPSHDDPGHSHDNGSGEENFLFTNGEPGDPAAAGREITVTASKGFRYEPRSLEVRSGETVTFVLENTDKIPHEFVLGNEAYQKLHETQMQEGGVFHEHDDYAATLDPGESGSITWTFTKAGRVQFGCHIPGHFDQGMVADIAIEA